MTIERDGRPPATKAEQRRAAQSLIPKGPRYREQYAVIVICRDEAEQERTYRSLQRRYQNSRLRVVAT